MSEEQAVYAENSIVVKYRPLDEETWTVLVPLPNYKCPYRYEGWHKEGVGWISDKFLCRLSGQKCTKENCRKRKGNKAWGGQP